MSETADSTPEPEEAPAGPCAHEAIENNAVFGILADDPSSHTMMRVEIQARCVQCGEPVRWHLETAGMHPTQATVEGVDRLVLRVPAMLPGGPKKIEPATPKVNGLWTPGQPR